MFINSKTEIARMVKHVAFAVLPVLLPVIMPGRIS
jgi:hypothetical protein